MFLCWNSSKEWNSESFYCNWTWKCLLSCLFPILRFGTGRVYPSDPEVMRMVDFSEKLHGACHWACESTSQPPRGSIFKECWWSLADRQAMNHSSVGRPQDTTHETPHMLHLWNRSQAQRSDMLSHQAVLWNACANHQFCVELPIDDCPARGVFTYILMSAWAGSNVWCQVDRTCSASHWPNETNTTLTID